MRSFVILSLLVAACGAPVESADQARAGLQASQPTLSDKVQALCAQVAGSPDCTDPGSYALNLTGMKALQFAAKESSSIRIENDDVQRIHTRVEVWLNRDLLQLIGALAGVIANAKDDPSALTKALSTGDGSDVFGQLVQSQVQVTKAPEMDLLAGTFTTEVEIKMTGAVSADNRIALAGVLGADAFATTIESVGPPPPYATSILRKISGLVLIVPYAGDVYLDMTLDLELYSLGLDSVVESSITSFIGSSLALASKFLDQLKA